VVVMHWGLIPSWHKEGEKLDFFRAFNARSETVRHHA
jgi:putative SOS response-associated peptidase YedK